jgi:hypothetical protein
MSCHQSVMSESAVVCFRTLMQYYGGGFDYASIFFLNL